LGIYIKAFDVISIKNVILIVGIIFIKFVKSNVISPNSSTSTFNQIKLAIVCKIDRDSGKLVEKVITLP